MGWGGRRKRFLLDQKGTPEYASRKQLLRQMKAYLNEAAAKLNDDMAKFRRDASKPRAHGDSGEEVNPVLVRSSFMWTEYGSSLPAAAV
jgi:hypothetical protein